MQRVVPPAWCNGTEVMCSKTKSIPGGFGLAVTTAQSCAVQHSAPLLAGAIVLFLPVVTTRRPWRLKSLVRAGPHPTSSCIVLCVSSHRCTATRDVPFLSWRPYGRTESPPQWHSTSPRYSSCTVFLTAGHIQHYTPTCNPADTW